MTDPRRLLEEGDLTEAERGALLAGKDMQPPPAFAEASWEALTSALGAPPNSPTDAGAASTGAAAAGSSAAGTSGAASASLLGKLATLSLVKAVALGAVSGGFLTTAVVVSTAPSPPPTSAAPAASLGSLPPAPPSWETKAPPAEDVPRIPATVERPSAEPPGDTVVPGEAPLPETARARSGPSADRDTAHAESASIASEGAASPSVAAFEVPLPSEAEPVARHGASVARSESEEARLVGRAREALRSGDPALALRVLYESSRRFPHGVVRQEREALLVEALVRLGRRDEAMRVATAFERNYPNSPYAARVQGLVHKP